MPALEEPGEHSLAYPQSLIDIGANAVLFGLIVPYESDGVILGDYVAYEWLAAAVEAYRGQGLAVGVALEPINVETQGGNLDQCRRRSAVCSWPDWVMWSNGWLSF